MSDLLSIGRPWGGMLLVPAITVLGLLALSLLMLPRAERTRGLVTHLAMIGLGSALALVTANPWLIALGWIISSVPVFQWKMPDRASRRWLIIPHAISGLGILLLVLLHGTIGPSTATAVLLALLVIMRAGIFPLQGPVIAAFEHASLLPVSLFIATQSSIVLLVHASALVPQELLGTMLDVICAAACVSSLLAGVRCFAERKPRRVVGHVLLSVSASAVAGLACMEPKGIAGGMLIWMVVAIASSGLVSVLYVLEARTDLVRDPRGHLGLNARAPRLGFFCLLFSLALIGLPGTLGFVAEDLLFHGTLHRFPVLGIALPLATALNAIHLLRLYHLLFNGVLPKDVAAIPDALRREALPLLIGCGLLVVLGIVPDIALSWSGPASTWLVDRLAHIIHP